MWTHITQALNQIVLSNRRAYADLYSRLMLADIEREKHLHVYWLKRVDDWKKLQVQASMDYFKWVAKLKNKRWLWLAFLVWYIHTHCLLMCQKGLRIHFLSNCLQTLHAEWVRRRSRWSQADFAEVEGRTRPAEFPTSAINTDPRVGERIKQVNGYSFSSWGKTASNFLIETVGIRFLLQIWQGNETTCVNEGFCWSLEQRHHRIVQKDW